MPVTYLAEATDTSLNAFLSSITGAYLADIHLAEAQENPSRGPVRFP